MKFHNTFQKNTFIATKIMFFNTKCNDENFLKKNVELGRVEGEVLAMQKNVGANDYSPLPWYFTKIDYRYFLIIFWVPRMVL